MALSAAFCFCSTHGCNSHLGTCEGLSNQGEQVRKIYRLQKDVPSTGRPCFAVQVAAAGLRVRRSHCASAVHRCAYSRSSLSIVEVSLPFEGVSEEQLAGKGRRQSAVEDAPVRPLETLMARGGRRSTMLKGGACRPHGADRGGQSRFPNARTTISVSWSGRNRLGNGVPCWINAPSAASRGRGASGARP